MKFVFGAAAAALIMAAAGPVFADCPASPPTPTLPDGATAKGSDMNKGNDLYNKWAVAAKAHLDCERKAIESLQSTPNVAAYIDAVAKLKTVQDSPEVKDYGAKVSAYNDEAQKLNAVGENWKAQGDAYNGKLKKH